MSRRLTQNQLDRMNSFQPYTTYSGLSGNDLKGYRPIRNPISCDVSTEAGYGCIDVGIQYSTRYKNSYGHTVTTSFTTWIQRVAPGDEYQLNNNIYRN